MEKGHKTEAWNLTIIQTLTSPSAYWKTDVKRELIEYYAGEGAVSPPGKEEHNDFYEKLEVTVLPGRYNQVMKSHCLELYIAPTLYKIVVSYR